MIYDKQTNTIREKATIDESHDEFFGSLKSYPCHHSCKELWEDGAEKTEGYDYIIRTDSDVLYAHPLPIQEESEDELWQSVFLTIENNKHLTYGEILVNKLKQSFTIKRKV